MSKSKKEKKELKKKAKAAAPKSKKKTETKVKLQSNFKRKAFYSIIAPKVFNNVKVGETPAAEKENVIGRSILVNLMTLTGNIKKQNKNARLTVDRVNGANAETYLSRLEMVSAFTKRLARKGKDKLDGAYICKTKDEKLVCLKYLLITR